MVAWNTCYFQPYLGKWSNLTDIFQRGLNHQPENCFSGVTYKNTESMPRDGQRLELTTHLGCGGRNLVKPPGGPVNTLEKVTNGWGWNPKNSPKNWPPAKSFEPTEKKTSLCSFFGGGWGFGFPWMLIFISRMYQGVKATFGRAPAIPAGWPRLGPLSQLQEINYLCDPRHGGIRSCMSSCMSWLVPSWPWLGYLFLDYIFFPGMKLMI